MHGGSITRTQTTGIRQGCTLQPFLSTIVLYAIMEGTGRIATDAHPRMTTPMVRCVALAYADDSVLIARPAEVAETLLNAVEY